MEPFDEPKQVVFAAVPEIVNAVGCVIVKFCVLEHPLLSVATTENVPAERPVKVPVELLVVPFSTKE